MSRFVQLHALTAYPPSNANRDDLGRPKTAEYGGVNRLRISSQALKRAIRTHDVFENKLGEFCGYRTKRLAPRIIVPELTSAGIDAADAERAAERVVSALGKVAPAKGDEKGLSEQLVFLSRLELKKATDCARRIAIGELKLPAKNESAGRIIVEEILRHPKAAVDIAMFGRMLTGSDNVAQAYSINAAVQVAHALTTHRCIIEDDYFSALDDLGGDQSAAHIDEAGFGAGVFYTYANINRSLLLENLAGDHELAGKALEAFVEAFALASPSGKKNSFANHVRAEFLLVTKGDQQPLTLANAFLNPVRSSDYAPDQMIGSIRALHRQRESFSAAYGKSEDAVRYLNVRAGEMEKGCFDDQAAPLADLARFAAEGVKEVPYQGDAA